MKRNDNVLKHSGKEYKAKRAEGDVKKEGKLEPFAFLPVESRLLNKRYRKKEAKKFDSLMGKKRK
jgi:ribosomal RNA-processing protein 12